VGHQKRVIVVEDSGRFLETTPLIAEIVFKADAA
jgi:hypothetical protein